MTEAEGAEQPAISAHASTSIDEGSARRHQALTNELLKVVRAREAALRGGPLSPRRALLSAATSPQALACAAATGLLVAAAASADTAGARAQYAVEAGIVAAAGFVDAAVAWWQQRLALAGILLRAKAHIDYFRRKGVKVPLFGLGGEVVVKVVGGWQFMPENMLVSGDEYLLSETPGCQQLEQAIVAPAKRPTSSLELYFDRTRTVCGWAACACVVLCVAVGLVRHYVCSGATRPAVWDSVLGQSSYLVMASLTLLLPHAQWAVVQAYCNARILALFHVIQQRTSHAPARPGMGLSPSSHGGGGSEANSHAFENGEAESVRVPARVVARYMLQFLGWRNEVLPHNTRLFQTLGSVTTVACLDKDATLVEPVGRPERVYLHVRGGLSSLTMTNSTTVDAETPAMPGASPHYARGRAGSRVHTLSFDDPAWREQLPVLKPIGLSSLLQRPMCRDEHVMHSPQICGGSHVNAETAGLAAAKAREPTTWKRIFVSLTRQFARPYSQCLCLLGKEIGFTDKALDNYTHVKEIHTYASGTDSDSVDEPPLQLLSKGNLPVLLKHCAWYWDGSEILQLGPEAHAEIMNQYENLHDAFTCIAFAYKPIPERVAAVISSQDAAAVAADAAAPQPVGTPSWTSHHVDVRFTHVAGAQSHAHADVDEKRNVRKLFVPHTATGDTPKVDSPDSSGAGGVCVSVPQSPCVQSMCSPPKGDTASPASKRKAGKRRSRGGSAAMTAAKKLVAIEQFDSSMPRHSIEVLAHPSHAAHVLPPPPPPPPPVNAHEAREKVFEELQTDQIFMGMVALREVPSRNAGAAIERLRSSGVRFMFFSSDNVRRSVLFAQRLGLDTGWNCVISLRDPPPGEPPLMDGIAKMPRGISHIRPHIANVDEVPLSVPIFCDADPASSVEMIKILQADVAAAYQPLPAECLLPHDDNAPNGEQRPPVPSPITSGTWLTQASSGNLSVDLTCLPCSFVMHHPSSLGVLADLVGEGRYVLRNAVQSLLCALCLSLAAAAASLWASLAFLPPLMSGYQLAWLALVVVPALSMSLLLARVHGKRMTAFVPKSGMNGESVKMTAAYVSSQALPLAACAFVAFVIALHDLRGGPWSQIVGFHASESEGDILGSDALLGAQNAAMFAFVCGAVPAALALAHPSQHAAVTLAKNLGGAVPWVLVSLALLLLQVAFAAVSFAGGRAFHVLPDASWYVYVIVFVAPPVVSLLVGVPASRRQQSWWAQHQLELKLVFETKLGMHSPVSATPAIARAQPIAPIRAPMAPVAPPPSEGVEMQALHHTPPAGAGEEHEGSASPRLDTAAMSGSASSRPVASES
eukprot:m51a1_g8164 hypothetical protein (1321) ;mRNA; f:77682-82439